MATDSRINLSLCDARGSLLSWLWRRCWCCNGANFRLNGQRPQSLLVISSLRRFLRLSSYLQCQSRVLSLHHQHPCHPQATLKCCSQNRRHACQNSKRALLASSLTDQLRVASTFSCRIALRRMPQTLPVSPIWRSASVFCRDAMVRASADSWQLQATT